MTKRAEKDYSKIYWRKAKRFSYLLQIVPFIRAVVLNGSLAQGKAKQSSDIDILIIAKDQRIFTVRFFVNILAILLGQKRSNDETRPHAGKFCFNYFLIESYLTIPCGRGREMDKYCAENYSRSVLLAGDQRLFEKFIVENSKLFSILCHSRPKGDPSGRGGLQFHSDYERQSNSGNPSMLVNSTKNMDPWSQATARDDKEEEATARDDKEEEATARDDKSRKQLRCFLVTFFRSISELLLSGWLGSWLEARLKSYQIKRIERDPRTKKYPNLIAYNDQELRFHPPKN